MFNEDSSDEVTVTIKKYNSAKGLSSLIHKLDNEHRFIVKGPLGKGLHIQIKGVHVAFTCGTGCFVFLDLVVYLIRRNLNLLSDEEKDHVYESFKFVFYVSFPTRDDGIGLQLCFGLDKLCKHLGIDNFELHTRFSAENSDRWDYTFLCNQRYDKQISKVWACGPPKMNEDFDKA